MFYLFKPTIIIGIILLIYTSSCVKTNQKNDISLSGTLYKQGMTAYQYGTHTLGGYALRSDLINLDDYVNQYVTVNGHKIDGYPVDNGPEYIEVEGIEK